MIYHHFSENPSYFHLMTMTYREFSAVTMILQLCRAVKIFFLKFGFLSFDPCFKNPALTFFWETLWAPKIQVINSQYQIWIVPKYGVSWINLEGSRAKMPQGEHYDPPLCKVGLKPIVKLVNLPYPISKDKNDQSWHYNPKAPTAQQLH